MTIVKSTVMRTEVDARKLDCRADRNITHEGKESLHISLHAAANGVGLGTISGSSYSELAATIRAFGEALEQLHAADGQVYQEGDQR